MIDILIYRKLKNLIRLGIGLPTASYLFVAEAQQSELERLVYSYGNLETAAGIGVREEKEVDGTTVLNLWLSEFEGAQATTIELSNPHMTMADRAGNLYIADKESHSVRWIWARHLPWRGRTTRGSMVIPASPAMHLFYSDGHVSGGTLIDLFNRRVRGSGSWRINKQHDSGGRCGLRPGVVSSGSV
ncbi:MAG: hypothetical protein R3F19_32185 [Verrucomicrobiales bacterium]